MTLDLSQIEDFRVLAETGNFSRAAALRHVTQPAFSRRIRALEDWAGTPLFDREAHPIVLTPAGEALRPLLAEALRCLTEGRDAARAAAERSRATLRFAATHVLSFTFFPTWLRALESGAPPGAVSLVSDSLQACEELMLGGGVQFLLCHHHEAAPSRLDPSRFPWHSVGADRLVPVAAPGGPALEEGRGALPFLAYSPESGLGRILAAAVPKAMEARLNAAFTAHHAATLRTMARAGRGLAWLPESLVAEDLAAGTLRRAGPVALDVPLDIRVIRPLALGAAAETFWSLVTRPLRPRSPMA
ncbi:LysR family transcriptional regulator [Roseomonas populi]|uniref:LysR substrate-binding domain-containing protein n=1 Tax=Roseomonas populi TaxID=3121582 RepID=A0ABT1WYF1_9PROT|nr:LysR substrate-binding domain-containing protein [Roseomonas pecuniae]MCR0980870.1 LysR substrate-binding domain-containing protein [Roseomonas pecuniae]